VFLGSDANDQWLLSRRNCPNCRKFIFNLENGTGALNQQQPNNPVGPGNVLVTFRQKKSDTMVYPRGVARRPVPPEVPADIGEEYKEACLVLADSPKASAALSRRCLQNLLRNAAGVKSGDLVGEIQQVLDSGKLPAGLSENIDAVRNIGNFAAHPNKSKSTGEVVDVEPHEAEWNLDVIEGLFDFYFVQPALARARRDALNLKLAAAGKPPMK
jgi:hypothetical protein